MNQRGVVVLALAVAVLIAVCAHARANEPARNPDMFKSIIPSAQIIPKGDLV